LRKVETILQFKNDTKERIKECEWKGEKELLHVGIARGMPGVVQRWLTRLISLIILVSICQSVQMGRRGFCLRFDQALEFKQNLIHIVLYVSHRASYGSIL
jgi:hypothetical protein